MTRNTQLSATDSGLQSLCEVFIAIILAVGFLGTRCAGKHTDFGEASALGAHTFSIFASRDGFPIHCQSGSEIEACLEGVARREMREQAIWLGNSQLHSINHYRAGEVNAPAMQENNYLIAALLMAGFLLAWGCAPWPAACRTAFPQARILPRDPGPCRSGRPSLRIPQAGDPVHLLPVLMPRIAITFVHM